MAAIRQDPFSVLTGFLIFKVTSEKSDRLEKVEQTQLTED